MFFEAQENFPTAYMSGTIGGVEIRGVDDSVALVSVNTSQDRSKPDWKQVAFRRRGKDNVMRIGNVGDFITIVAQVRQGRRRDEKMYEMIRFQINPKPRNNHQRNTNGNTSNNVNRVVANANTNTKKDIELNDGLDDVNVDTSHFSMKRENELSPIGEAVNQA